MQRYRLALKNNVKEVLENLPLFSSWSQTNLDELAAHAVLEYYGPNYAIVREGDPCEFLYVIKQGIVRLSKAIPKPDVAKSTHSNFKNSDLDRNVEKPGHSLTSSHCL